MPPFNIIVAVDSNLGIGKNGQLPWRLPGEIKHFKEITTKTSVLLKQNAVVMGRKTWESLPEKFKPLASRINIVLSKNADLKLPDNVKKVTSFEEMLKLVEGELKPSVENIFIIGGADVFKEAFLKLPEVKIYLTQITGHFNCDVFFPSLPKSFKLVSKAGPFVENSLEYCFLEYVREYF